MNDAAFSLAGLPTWELASIRFVGPWPLGWTLLAATTLAVAAGLYYLRETAASASPWNVLLPALRSAAIFLIVLLMAGPVWHRETVIGTLGRVIFAVDTSASMSVRDSAAEDHPDRLDRVMDRLVGRDGPTTATDDETAVDGLGGWIEELQDTHQIDLVAFDAGPPKTLWSTSSRSDRTADASELSDVSAIALDVVADGPATDLQSPLRLLARGSASDPATNQAQQNRSITPVPTALVLLSDGQANVRGSGFAVAPRNGQVVHGVGFGRTEEPNDLGVIDVQTPDSIAMDGRLVGKVLVKQVGSDGAVRVRIRNDAGVEVFQTELDSEGLQWVPFDVNVKDILGDDRRDDTTAVRRTREVLSLTASVESTTTAMTGDELPDNDALPFRVAASTRDRQLLIIDGSSRWEIRYLRNLFDRDPTWNVDSIIFGPGTDTRTLRRGDDPGEFPSGEVAMSRYDAIVLGELPEDTFTEEDAQRLMNFVSRGGGLILLDGRYQKLKGMANNELGDLFPVDIGDLETDASTAIQPVAGFENHPLFDLSGDEGSIRELWESLPSPTIANRVLPRPGAEVWARLRYEGEPDAPFLVSRMFGGGRVFYLASDQTWRWRYKVADPLHARFWNQLLSAVMQPPYAASDDFASIATDAIQYEPGQSASIRVRMRNVDGSANGDATVDAILSRDGVTIATVPLSVDDPSRGTYRGTTDALPEGEYEVRVRASGYDSRSLRASTSVWVGRDNRLETARLSLQPDTLTKLANDGGGKYFSETSADDLLAELKPLSSGRILRTDFPLMQSWWYFAAVLALLAAEWLIRKRASLV